jgi:serine phosphatase RsbU (regulator of sigma subunit)
VILIIDGQIMNYGNGLQVKTDTLAVDGIRCDPCPYGERFGKALLRKIIRDNHSKSPPALTEWIVERVKAFRGPDPLQDDITLVVIKRNAVEKFGSNP